MRKKTYAIIFLIFILFLISGCKKAGKEIKESPTNIDLEDSQINFNSVESKLTTIPEKYKEDPDFISSDFIFSPNGKQVAYTVRKNVDDKEKEFVILNNKEGKAYDEVWSLPFFSSDSQNLAYIAIEDKKWFAVVNDKEGKPYDDFAYDTASPVFSPDSQHIAYVAKDKKYYLIVDDKEIKSYDYIGHPTFSPDGQRLVYRVRQGNNHFVVIDGKEGKAYEGISWSSDEREDVFFSPDSQKYSYMARQGKKSFVVLNEEENNHYDQIRLPIVFSPDSKRLAYVAISYEKSGIRGFVVVDGQASKTYDSIQPKSLKFSPDSKQFAYIASEGGKQFVVQGDKEGKPYDNIDSFVFSPDGSKVAFVASDIARHKGKQFVVLDEKEGKPYNYDIIDSISFTPDSKNVVYIASEIIDDERQVYFIVIGNKEGKIYDDIGRILFTPAPKFNPSFIISPDSKKISYGAKSGDDILWVDETII